MFSSPEKRTFVLALFLVVATLALYNGVGRYPFINFDDNRYVTENPQVRAGLTAGTLRWAFTTTTESNWHPLTWLSHALDCQLFGTNAGGHHYVNVLLHAVNAVLLFLILQRAAGYPWRSLMAALLFAVHPVNVESVAWVAERKNVLSMLFFLLALMAYERYAKQQSGACYLQLLGLFACGLMAKPMVITLPFVLLLWDYWPLQRMNLGTDRGTSGGKFVGQRAARPSRTDEQSNHYPSRPLPRLILEKLPLFALSAISAVITMKVQNAGGAMNLGQQFALAPRVENALLSYVGYLRMALWPAGLAPFYPHPGSSLGSGRVLLATGILIAGTVAVIRAHQRQYLLVGWFWFLGTLVPMIGLVQVGGQAMADRYAYLPFVGLFVMACWGVPDFARAVRVPAWWLAPAGAMVVLVLMLLTYRQLMFWKSDLALWSRTVAVTGPNFVAQDNLGNALVAEGRIEEALPHFEAAAQIYPQDPVAWLNIATHNQLSGRISEAIGQFQAVLTMTSDTALRTQALENLGSAYRQNRDYTQARQSYESALSISPDDSRALVGMGLASLKSGDSAGAAASFTRAMEIQPTAVGYLLLQEALEKQGETQKAEAAHRQAQALARDMDSAQKTADLLSTQ